MSGIAQRLSKLEVVYQAVDFGEMSALEREWYLAYCGSSFTESIHSFAGSLAERKYQHEAGNRSPHAMDWLLTTTSEQRAAAVDQQITRLLEMGHSDEDHALTEWIETADREGWPWLRGMLYPMSRTGFEERVAESRKGMDLTRGTDMPGAAAWRRPHPTWRPGMTGDEAMAFELALIAEADQLHAQWFESQATTKGIPR